jgi:hypothetical protein
MNYKATHSREYWNWYVNEYGYFEVMEKHHLFLLLIGVILAFIITLLKFNSKRILIILFSLMILLSLNFIFYYNIFNPKFSYKEMINTLSEKYPKIVVIDDVSLPLTVGTSVYSVLDCYIGRKFENYRIIRDSLYSHNKNVFRAVLFFKHEYKNLDKSKLYRFKDISSIFQVAEIFDIKYYYIVLFKKIDEENIKEIPNVELIN